MNTRPPAALTDNLAALHAARPDLTGIGWTWITQAAAESA